jgi:hypothetical protein
VIGIGRSPAPNIGDVLTVTSLDPPEAQWQPGGGGAADSLIETGGPTELTIGAIADGQVLRRIGTTIVGTTVSAIILSVGPFGTFHSAFGTTEPLSVGPFDLFHPGFAQADTLSAVSDGFVT